ncbi:cytochrome P450 6g1-like isoform X1 [Eurosta solidaginis]|uniref:cytochrome P450 6g1-like isoform X1 n=2 Tax=Eurosta solidaginis TaxID=178769 RepID=UPI003530806A
MLKHRMFSIASIFLLTTVLAIVYARLRHKYTFWEREGVNFWKPTPFMDTIKLLFGQNQSVYLYFSDIHNDPKMSKAAAVGMHLLDRPALLLREPELIKSVMIKNFHKFSNRCGTCDPHIDTLGSNTLFFTNNPKWRDLRVKLTPLYTTAKVKQLFPLMKEVGDQLESHLANKGKSFVAEMKELCGSFTIDMIARTALGIQANSFTNPNGELSIHGRRHLHFDLGRAFTFLIMFFYPKYLSTFRIQFFRPEFAAFLRKSIDEIFIAREKSKAKRNDLIDTLLELKKEMIAKGEYDEVAHDTLLAQAGIFFTAGSDTSSSAMAYTLYEMAKHPDMQERLRSEICDAFIAGNGDMTYEILTNLPYLNMVVDETLRMYPALPSVDRVHMPSDGEAPFDLRPYYDYTLPKGMPIYISVYGIQHDAKYWPNPYTYDPERFSPEYKKLHEPLAYMPFGAGPRKCIGNRIGLLQAKLGLALFLKNHYVEVCDKTPPEIKFDRFGFVMSYKKGIYLNVIEDGLYESRAAND